MGRQTGLGAGRKYVAQRVGAVVALAGLLWAAGGLGDRRLQAASVTVVQGNGNTVFDNSNAANEVDFDIIWSNNLPVQLEVQLDAGDTGPTAFFSGFHAQSDRRQLGRLRCRAARRPDLGDNRSRSGHPWRYGRPRVAVCE